ncbi:MAG: hypothetical protein LKE52_01105 [Bacilli bacterium]|jgi:uncharacterized ubiquitin-like protein YukD|nr:hypothetical protein [Bacilli bacterium]
MNSAWTSIVRYYAAIGLITPTMREMLFLMEDLSLTSMKEIGNFIRKYAYTVDVEKYKEEWNKIKTKDTILVEEEGVDRISEMLTDEFHIFMLEHTKGTAPKNL